MKRGAEKQLTKDGGSDVSTKVSSLSGIAHSNFVTQDDDEIEETAGFRKADDSILAGRKCVRETMYSRVKLKY